MLRRWPGGTLSRQGQGFPGWPEDSWRLAASRFGGSAPCHWPDQKDGRPAAVRPEKRRAVSFLATRWRPPPPQDREGASTPPTSSRGVLAPEQWLLLGESQLLQARPWSRRGAGALGSEDEGVRAWCGGDVSAPGGRQPFHPHWDRAQAPPDRSAHPRIAVPKSRPNSSASPGSKAQGRSLHYLFLKHVPPSTRRKEEGAKKEEGGEKGRKEGGRKGEKKKEKQSNTIKR